MTDDPTPSGDDPPLDHETTFGAENAPDQTPDDAFVGAFALLMRGERPSYAALRTESGLDLPRARRDDSGSYRDSLLATLGERLGLDPKRDLVASGVPRAHLNSRLCGKGSGEPRWYVAEFFVVRLYGKAWPDKLAARDDVVWLTGEEVMAGGKDGLRLADDTLSLLRIAEAIPPDEQRST